MDNLVITFIAGPASALTQEFIDTMARSLAAQGARWLEKGVACDLSVVGEQQLIASKINAFLGGHPLLAIDYIIQSAVGRRKKLLVADMESTIITCECLDELADFLGLRDKIAAITARAMNGELDFEMALRERVRLLKGLPESSLQRVYNEKVRLMPGAEVLVKTMRAQGAYCMLVSGGFDFFAARVAEILGFQEWRANRLEIENGMLTGNVISPILGKEAKLQALQESCNKLGISSQESLAVGDGANDLPILLEAGLGVAYHAKPNVRSQAKARIDHADLRALLWAQV